MTSQKPALAEFMGSLALMLVSGLLPLLNINGLDFPASFSLVYGSLLLLLRDAEVKTLNPALTLADMFRNRIDSSTGFMIILVQFAGASVGGIFLSFLGGGPSVCPTSATAAVASSQLLLVQVVFAAALAFSYFNGCEDNKYYGIWLAALMYGAFSIGGPAAASLNPAVALAGSVCSGISGVATDEETLASLVFTPLIGSGLAFIVDKSTGRQLYVSELIGTFFLSFGLLAATGKPATTAAAIGISLYSASVVKISSPITGGALNPAVTGGAVLIEGRSITKEIISFWFYQLCGAAAAAAILTPIMDSSPAVKAILTCGDIRTLVLYLCFSALLMIMYCIDIEDVFGSPACLLIGSVYGLAFLWPLGALSLNPAPLLAAFIAAVVRGLASMQIAAAAAKVSLPFIGCLCGGLLLRLVPSDYRRRV